MDSAASDTKATHIIAPRNSVSAVDWRTIAVLRSLAHGQRVAIIIVSSMLIQFIDASGASQVQAQCTLPSGASRWAPPRRTQLSRVGT